VLALDSSVDHLEELRRVATAPNIFFLLGSADVLPLPDESADAVCARFGTAEVRDEAEALREFSRVLRRGGRVSIFESSRKHDEDPGAPTLNFDEHELERHLREAGFVDVTLELPSGESAEAGAPLYVTAAKP
jgi:ubiquinone/menaquinone biosynthesis C-methylase UbiE